MTTLSEAYDQIDQLNAEAQALEADEGAQAYSLASQAYAQAETAGYAAGMARALLTMASVNERHAAYAQSIQQAMQVLALAEQLADDTLRSGAYCILGWDYYHLSDYPTGITWALRQLQLAEASGSLVGQAEAHNLIGSLYGELESDNLLCLAHYERSLALYRQAGYLDKEAALLNNLCITYLHIGRYEEALAAGEQALAISRQINSRYTEALVLGNLALVHGKRDEDNIAHDYYMQRLHMSLVWGYAMLHTHTLLHIGRLYDKRGLPVQALRILQQALTESEAAGNRKWIADSHHRLALVFKRMGDFERALHHFQQYHGVEREVFGDEARVQAEKIRTIHDVERMEAALTSEQQQREQDRLYFERMNMLKDNIINIVSHDLKNPLASIFLNLDRLTRLHQDDTQTRELLERIKRHAQQMRSMIDQLLDKAMLENGRGLVISSVSLPPLLEDVRHAASTHASHKAITLTVKLPEQPLQARLDANRMRQALNNLVSNAIKFTQEGGQVCISADAEADTLVLRIADNGTGIPADALPHLFEPFYRVAAHQAIEGTGLGLSIVKAIIDQHGGTMTVESEEGNGATFTIRLPGALA